MTFKNIAHTIPDWLIGDGPESDFVISSRARLARNIQGMFYPHHAEESQLNDVVSGVLDAASGAGFDPGNYFSNSDLNDLQKGILIERHLISPSLASKVNNRGVLVNDSEHCSVMVNEEDHLRIQVMRSGFDPFGAAKEVAEIEEKLSQEMTFSISKDYGFLTSCPTNFGTGLRISVLIHLPALVISKEMQKVIRSAGQLGMVVRGYRGEGTDVIGNMFQISNQRSFGKSESQIVDELVTFVNQTIEYEKNAADMLVKGAKHQLLDKIWRSLGLLKTAHVMSSHEYLNLVSAVRMGRYLGYINKPELSLLNELMISTQPGHLQERNGGELDPLERDRIRASQVRERFLDVMI